MEEKDKNLDSLRSNISENEQTIAKLKNQLSLKDWEITDAKKGQIDPDEHAKIIDQLNTVAINQDLSERKLRQAEEALIAERNKPAEPVGPKTFFIGTSAAPDPDRGFIYQEKPEVVDDLTRIKGVGAGIEQKLNNSGVYQFKQIALWDHQNITAFSKQLSFTGRIEREQWVAQATDLHRQDHREPVAPLVDIFQPQKNAPAKKVIIEKIITPEPATKKATVKKAATKKSAPVKKAVAKKAAPKKTVVKKKAATKKAIPKKIAVKKAATKKTAAKKVAAKKSAPAKKAAPKKKTAKSYFRGESIKEDSTLGIIFTRRPKKADDLKLIKGVANVLERKLHRTGIYRFKQISLWKKAQIEAFGELLSFRDRIQRDEWVKQARALDKKTK